MLNLIKLNGLLMNGEQNIIQQFFNAFKKLDATTMNACYTNNIAFNDPMFDLLRGDEVRAMWQMLCANASNFSLEYDSIKDEGDGYYTCNWTAQYTFSKTGRRVINKCKAYMKIENGLIAEHSDAWSLHKWSEQAIGLPGKLLGWAGFFRRRIKNNARKNLLHFMQQNH
ncbi:nuclear transport factor 2 family protein [Ferruginibacter yonginensis]|uniref:Nuclear transport factor 2 family protein n=1 Tax=Ferruginibacter yonginensis TaxID=1310416 RepID=A0ABV8QQ75_9BACT